MNETRYALSALSYWAPCRVGSAFACAVALPKVAQDVRDVEEALEDRRVHRRVHLGVLSRGVDERLLGRLRQERRQIVVGRADRIAEGLAAQHPPAGEPQLGRRERRSARGAAPAIRQVDAVEHVLVPTGLRRGVQRVRRGMRRHRLVHDPHRVAAPPAVAPVARDVRVRCAGVRPHGHVGHGVRRHATVHVRVERLVARVRERSMQDEHGARRRAELHAPVGDVGTRVRIVGGGILLRERAGPEAVDGRQVPRVVARGIDHGSGAADRSEDQRGDERSRERWSGATCACRPGSHRARILPCAAAGPRP